jgi:hypothetical protein
LKDIVEISKVPPDKQVNKGVFEFEVFNTETFTYIKNN